MLSLLKTLFYRVVTEPAVVVGVIIAALDATTVQTWQGYAVAVGVALLRFAVSPTPIRRVLGKGKVDPTATLSAFQRHARSVVAEDGTELDTPPARGSGFDRP